MSQSASPPEPRNPFYILLIIVSFLFVLTALAYALVPTLEQKAADLGQPAPPSPLRDSLRQNGWQWLLCEVAAMTVLSLLSMGLDRLRRLQKERPVDKITPEENDPKPS
jgi:hypothetical protein